MWWWWEVMRMRKTRIFTQLLNTILHVKRKNYSLFHCWRWRAKWSQAWTMRCWIITCTTWCIISWREHKTRFITQSCFSSKQCSHLQAHLMRAQYMWIITMLRRWTQQQHQIFWSWWFNICQHLSKHAEINMFIKDHEFSHQRNKCKESRRSRRSRRRRRCSDDDAKKNVHLKKISKLREHVSMISMSMNAATYHDSDDDDDDVDTAMSLTLAHELTCITTTLQRKKLISWAASYARYI